MKLIILFASCFISASTLHSQVTKIVENKGLLGPVDLGAHSLLESSIDRNLWTTDGTPSGTVSFTDSNLVKAEAEAVLFKKQSFFAGTNLTSGTELWVTDGTLNGTHIVKDINPGADSSSPHSFFVLNDTTLLFYASTLAAGNELWKTDGTTAGTVMIKDIKPGTQSSSDFNVFFKRIGNSVVFFANENEPDHEMWKTDGSTNGTVFIKDITSPGIQTVDFLFTIFYNDKIFFLNSDIDLLKLDLWSTDGTTAGTQIVTNLDSGNLFISSFAPFTLVNNKIIFNAFLEGLDPFNPIAPYIMWASDGTANGTTKIYENSAFSGLGTGSFSIINNHLLFGGFQDSTGAELWQTDGTIAGTKLLKDINTGTSSSSPFFLTEIIGGNDGISDVLNNYTKYMTQWKGKSYFSADDGVNGKELWETDGTTIGTKLFKDIYSGSHGSVSEEYPQVLFTQNKFFFLANSGAQVGRELFMSDGTPQGTKLVADISPGPDSSNISLGSIYKNQVYFSDIYRKSNGDTTNDLFKVDTMVTALPIQLFNFAAAVKANNFVDLKWSTANQSGSSYFDLERSLDGVHFSYLTKIDVLSNVGATKSYAYSDEQTAHLNTTLLYYRLKLVDKDGSFQYSQVLDVRLKEGDMKLFLSPNPAQNQLTVSVGTKNLKRISLSITDVTGKKIYQVTIPVDGDVYQQAINLTNMSKGVYFLQMISSTNTITRSFIKQ